MSVYIIFVSVLDLQTAKDAHIVYIIKSQHMHFTMPDCSVKTGLLVDELIVRVDEAVGAWLWLVMSFAIFALGLPTLLAVADRHVVYQLSQVPAVVVSDLATSELGHCIEES